MNNSINVMLLLDPTSKGLIKTNLSSFTAKGIQIVTSLDEIVNRKSTNVNAQINKVIILEGYLQETNGFSDLRLYKVLFGLEYFFISSSLEYLAIMKDLATVFQSDITLLNYQVIQEAIFGVVKESVQSVDNKDLSIDLAKNLITSQTKYPTNVIQLANTYLNLVNMNEHLLEKISLLEEQHRTIDNENVYLRKLTTNTTEKYKKVFAESIRLNKLLAQYEINYTSDVLKKIDIHKYQRALNVIYMKVYENLTHFNSLIETLFDTFRLQERKSIKVLQIFDSSSNRQIQVLPKYYHILRNIYKSSEITTNDFLVKFGDYQKVLDLICSMEKLDVLILIDYKITSDTIISGNFVQLNVCGNSRHLAAFDLSKEDTIVNQNGILCWEDYTDLPAQNRDRFLYLSAKPIIQHILTLYRNCLEKV